MQQSGTQQHFWLEEHCTPARLDKAEHARHSTAYPGRLCQIDTALQMGVVADRVPLDSLGAAPQLSSCCRLVKHANLEMHTLLRLCKQFSILLTHITSPEPVCPAKTVEQRTHVLTDK